MNIIKEVLSFVFDEAQIALAGAQQTPLSHMLAQSQFRNPGTAWCLGGILTRNAPLESTPALRPLRSARPWRHSSSRRSLCVTSLVGARAGAGAALPPAAIETSRHLVEAAGELFLARNRLVVA